MPAARFVKRIAHLALSHVTALIFARFAIRRAKRFAADMTTGGLLRPAAGMWFNRPAYTRD
jgi:hypothetical protein